MRRLTQISLLALILTAILIVSPASVAAAGASGLTDSGLTIGVFSPNSAVGVLAAAGCGFFARWTVLTAGTQVGIIAGAVACCALALVDGLVS